MTTAEKESVERQNRGPATVHQPSPSALRRSASIRVAIAVLLAGALTAALIAALWGPLHTKTAVIGYPIFADFNPYNYSYAYYLVVGLFPITAVLIFFGLTWLGPRVGLATPPSRGRLRPLASAGEADQSLHPDPSPPPNRRVGQAARVVSVGAVIGLEVGIASNHLWPTVVLVLVGYCLGVAVVSFAWCRLVAAQANWDVALARVDALGTALTLGGLMLISAHTEVHILAGGTVHRYPWFPVWLGVPLTAVLASGILVSLRRAGPAAAAAIERRTVLLIAAPVALFVLAARVPGDLGQLNVFELGQSVTETMLVGHGWLPWRDVVLTHGLLGDVAPTAVGWGLFGNSYWGAYAGLSFIFLPLAVMTTYLLLAYLVGRSWPMLLIAGLIYVGTWFGSVDPRFLLWPIVLLLLAALLQRSTRVRAVALGVLVVAQAIVTPEMAPGVLIAIAVVAGYEWYWRSPGAPLTLAFQRTIRLAIAIVVPAVAFVIYVASRGALGDLIYVTVNLVSGHTLDGAIPPQNTQSGIPEARFIFVALAPVAALLISFAYAVVRLRLRRPFLPADWPMAAAALFVLFYYTKFLARMDIPHAYQPFMVATPLMVYIIYRAVTDVERWFRSRLPERPLRWISRPVAIALLAYFVVSFWGSLHTVVDSAPADYRPAVPAPAAFARVGYSSLVDGPALEDLDQIVNAYLGPHDRLLDITDEPALFYYFLDREPSLRWYAPNGIVATPELQRDLLAELRRAPPKLIIFDDTDTKMYGLATMDGIPVSVRLYLVSRWILGHYRPLLESHGRTIYALPGIRPISSHRLRLHEQPAAAGVRFLGQSCSWGYGPGFLAAPAEPVSGAKTVPVRTTSGHGPQVTFVGWAGDLRTRKPAREVVATFNGRIVGRTTPDTNRPDVPKAGFPAGFGRSGFRLSIPTWANASKALRVFAIGRDGSVAPLQIMGDPVQGGPARIGSRSVSLQPSADTGHVDGETASGGLLQIKPPAGSAWRDYRWLEIDAQTAGGFLPGAFSLSDRPDPTDVGHVIDSATSERSPHRYVVPVSSCQQWDGYGSRPLFLTPTAGQQNPVVRVIR